MSFDKTEFLEAREAARDKPAVRRQLETIRQAAVQAELLTGDPAWDHFMSLVQPQIEAATLQRDALRTDLENTLLVDDTQVRLRRIGIIRLNERIASLSWVLSMPKKLKDLGERATEEIAKLPEIVTDKESSTK